MRSCPQRNECEARGATLFLWLKIIAVLAFIAAVFLPGGNRFTGELPGDSPVTARE